MLTAALDDAEGAGFVEIPHQGHVLEALLDAGVLTEMENDVRGLRAQIDSVLRVPLDILNAGDEDGLVCEHMSRSGK